MTCDESRELMLDVLYGEAVNSGICFQFFKHLDACPDCSGEYAEFLSTREMLRAWEVEVPETVSKAAASFPASRRVGGLAFDYWWPMLQRVAAGFLILLGIISIFQHFGYLGDRQLTVSEKQLSELLHDRIVAAQTEERRLIGQALIHLKEDLDIQRRQEMQEVYSALVSLEERYADNLEESNRYLKALLIK
jgi:hypothetical protein